MVNGTDADTGRQELYSINYSWSTSDHSWRWRAIPDGAATMTLSDDDTKAGTETIAISISQPARVYTQTVRLREDTTLHMKGTRARANGTVDVGRWFQKYLPANRNMSPAASALVAATPPPKPADGYMHPWEFLPEATFTRADAFSHFGVYDTVNSRGQYYLVDLDETMLPAGLGENARWDDLTGQLTVLADKFNWEFLARRQPPIETHHFQSMFTPGRIMLKLVKRAPLGWIAMHWDKRDDDLRAFDKLPKTVQLSHGDSSLEVTIKSHVQVWRWPEVQEAVVTVHRSRDQITSATISFFSNQPEPGLGDNVWRVRIAAIPVAGGVVPLFDRERSGNFTRRDLNNYWYDCEWIVNDANERALAEQFCTEEGRLRHGSSVWFEDAVGHVSTAERTRFVVDPAGM